MEISVVSEYTSMFFCCILFCLQIGITFVAFCLVTCTLMTFQSHFKMESTLKRKNLRVDPHYKRRYKWWLQSCPSWMRYDKILPQRSQILGKMWQRGQKPSQGWTLFQGKQLDHFQFCRHSVRGLNLLP